MIHYNRYLFPTNVKKTKQYSFTCDIFYFLLICHVKSKSDEIVCVHKRCGYFSKAL